MASFSSDITDSDLLTFDEALAAVEPDNNLLQFQTLVTETVLSHHTHTAPRVDDFWGDEDDEDFNEGMIALADDITARMARTQEQDDMDVEALSHMQAVVEDAVRDDELMAMAEAAESGQGEATEAAAAAGPVPSLPPPPTPYRQGVSAALDMFGDWIPKDIEQRRRERLALMAVDIDDLQPFSLWPDIIKKTFFSPDLTHPARFRMAAFFWFNGVNPVLIQEWFSLLGSFEGSKWRREKEFKDIVAQLNILVSSPDARAKLCNWHTFDVDVGRWVPMYRGPSLYRSVSEEDIYKRYVVDAQ